MSARKHRPLFLETLENRLALSGNPIVPVDPPVEVLTSSPNGGGSYQTTPMPVTGGGIEGINPLPNLGNLPPRPSMPVNPETEAAILVALNADLAATQVAINNLDPTDENYLQDLAVLQLRQALLTSCISTTGAIASNVLAFASLSAAADTLEAVIAPLLANPPTTVEGMNQLLGLLSQYGAICGQMTQLVNSTVDLMAARDEMMSVLGIPTGY